MATRSLAQDNGSPLFHFAVLGRCEPTRWSSLRDRRAEWDETYWDMAIAMVTLRQNVRPRLASLPARKALEKLAP